MLSIPIHEYSSSVNGLHHISQSIWKFMIKHSIIKASRHEMLQSLIGNCFDKEYLDSQISYEGKSVDIWLTRRSEEYEECFSFYDVEICASQCSGFTNHYISSMYYVLCVMYLLQYM